MMCSAATTSEKQQQQQRKVSSACRAPTYCFVSLSKHFALGPQRSVGLLGTGWAEGGGGGRGREEGGEGGKRMKARPRALTLKTEEVVDRRQNNPNVKAMSPHHRVANGVLRNCSFDDCAEQSHKDNVRSIAVE